MARKKASELEPEITDGLTALLDGDVAARLRKAYGPNIIRKASSVDDRLRFRIPTGIFPLDFALSGGFAVGRFTTIYGPKSSSKTSTALRAIGNAQKMCARCWIPWNPITGEITCICPDGPTRTMVVYIDVEQTYGQKWTEKMGIDLDQLAHITPEFGEQATNIIEELIGSGKVHVILLDSIAEMVPSTVIEKGAQEGIMAVFPLMIARAYHKFLAAMQRCEVNFGFRPTMLMINQIRHKVGVMFGSPEITPGGNQPGFLASTELRVQGKKPETADALFGADTVLVEFRVTKQKTGVPYREGSFQMVLRDQEFKKAGDIIDEPEIMKYAEKVDFLVRDKAKWLCLDRSFSKKEDVEHALMTDPEFSNAVRTQLMLKLLGSDI